MVAQEVACVELEVLEVEQRLALFGGRVLGREQIEQLLQQLAVARGELVEGGLVQALPGVLEPGGTVAGGPERREVEEQFRIGTEGERRVRRRDLPVACVGVVEELARRVLQ